MLKKALTVLFLITEVLGDTNNTIGYIMYCPCMGRFGNQADHFLGVLAFSRAINRTLVIPPWVEYKKGALRSNQIPFDTYFKVEPLFKFNTVILMHEFMEKYADGVWPKDQRTSFCYIERHSLNKSNTEKGCHAKDGNPFGPFWDTYDVNFFKSEFYGPLHFDVHHSTIANKWTEKYPPLKWPVIAFTGAPASFPIQFENRYLQRYLTWNDKYISLAKEKIKEMLPLGAFIGIHLRNGIDWVRACEHIKNSQNLFASPQCLGYNNEKGELYNDLCMPPKEIIIKQLKRLIKKVKQENPLNEVKSIFVASDNNHMLEDINFALARMNVSAYKLATDNSHLDLTILGLANHFIGNCISSFTGFVKRERDIKGFPSSFWAFPKEKERRHADARHDEL